MNKFRYVYSNGKEIKTFIYTIEEIENNCVYEDTTGFSIDFKLISRDRFAGEIYGEVFENDILLDTHGQKHRVYFSDKHGWKTKNLIDFRHFTLTKVSYRGFEIISNTHIEKLKVVK